VFMIWSSYGLWVAVLPVSLFRLWVLLYHALDALLSPRRHLTYKRFNSEKKVDSLGLWTGDEGSL